MTMASLDDATASVVSADDWIKGITFSILASIIGGASKLSIRKSWLLDAKRRERPQNETDYEEIFSPTASSDNIIHRQDNNHQNHNHGDTTSLAPLEVGSPSRQLLPLSHAQDSFASHDNNNDNNSNGDNGSNTTPSRKYFFHNKDPSSSFNYYKQKLLKKTNSLFSKSKTKTSITQTQISWLLYLSGMIGMSFLNPLCCVLAMKYANPSILAPFSGLTLVWVVLFSGVAVGEYPGRSQQVACGLIVCGEILVAMFGDHTNGEERGVDDVLSSYRDPSFHIFILFITLYLIQLCIFILVCPKHSLLRKLAWGSIGGAITGFQNFLKDALTIYDATTKQTHSSSSSTKSSNDDLPPSFFFFVVMAMLTAFIGLLFLAACMKRYDATYSAAMFVVSFVVSASLMSSVHYSTFQHLDGFVNYVMYPMGLFVLFLGAFILVKPSAVGTCLAVGGDHDSTEELLVDDAARPHDESDVDYRERLLNGD